MNAVDGGLAYNLMTVIVCQHAPFDIIRSQILTRVNTKAIPLIQQEEHLPAIFSDNLKAVTLEEADRQGYRLYAVIAA